MILLPIEYAIKQLLREDEGDILVLQLSEQLSCCETFSFPQNLPPASFCSINATTHNENHWKMKSVQNGLYF
jgi:hypothetical protein